MKKIIILIGMIAIILSCSKDDSAKQCDCTKTLYVYYPQMSSAGAVVPAHYDSVGVFEVQVDCNEETADYVEDRHSNYTHYKIICD
jgi:hypothetical protein